MGTTHASSGRPAGPYRPAQAAVRRTPSWQRERAFTLIELLVVIAIIAVLAAILFPVFAQARDRSRAVSCQSNLKQMGTAFAMYCQDSDETYPPVPNWKSTLQPYIKNTAINTCPSRPALPWYYGQGYNIGCASPYVAGFPLQSMAQIAAPANKILVAEWDRCNAGPPCGPVGLLSGGATSFWAVCRVHSGGSNVLFGDGHVKWLRPDAYHSNTDSMDAAGNPIGIGGTTVQPVAAATWRSFWDTAWE